MYTITEIILTIYTIALPICMFMILDFSKKLINYITDMQIRYDLSDKVCMLGILLMAICLILTAPFWAFYYIRKKIRKFFK